MREIVYKFNQRGLYETDQDKAFNGETHLKLIIEPHSYSIQIGNDILRESSSAGYTIIVSNCGGTEFFSEDGNAIAKAEESGKDYKKVRLEWKNGTLSVCFGKIEEIDCYPNCDGEYDRWEYRWATQREIILDQSNNTLTVKGV